MLPDKEIWLDAQLSPVLSSFIFQTCNIPCKAIRELGLRDANDIEIYHSAKQREKAIIIITKDSDFIDLVIRHGSPRQIIFLTCGNTSNAQLREIFSLRLSEAINLLNSSENSIVEITD